MNVSRRAAIKLCSGLLTAGPMEGVMTDRTPRYFNSDGDGDSLTATVDNKRILTDELHTYRGVGPGGRSELKIYPAAGPGFAFDADAPFYDDVTATEGIEYHDGALYLATKGEGDAIYELDRQGNVVDSMADPRLGHINTICWFEGEMWAASATSFAPYETTTLLVIDWASKSIEDEIAFDDAASEMQLRAMIPTIAGGSKMLLTEYDFDDDAVATGAIVDPSGFRDGRTVAGNIEATIDCDWEVQLQGAEFRNGYLYAVDHQHVAKFKFPFADHIADGYQLTSGLEWFLPSPSGLSTLEQIALDPETGTWYLPAEGGVYTSRELNGTRRLGEWGEFASAVGGVESSRVLGIDSASVGSAHDVLLTNGMGYKGIVEVWLYDDLSTTGRLRVAVAQNDANQALAIYNDQTTSNYCVATDATSWQDSGIARPDSPQWVKMVLDVTDSSRMFAVSKDCGETFEVGPEIAGGPSRVKSLRINPTNDANGPATGKVGTWTMRIVR